MKILELQDKHYDSRQRLYTTSYAIVYDRIRWYFVVLLDARITTVSRRVVYAAVCHRIRTSFSLMKRSNFLLLPPQSSPSSTPSPSLLSPLLHCFFIPLPSPGPHPQHIKLLTVGCINEMDLNKK